MIPPLEERLKEVGLSLAVYQTLPPKYIRLNPRKPMEREQLESILKARLRLTGLEGVYRTDSLLLGSHPLYKEGYFHIQDLSSCLPALVLDPHTGERVLDLCAGPGVKAAYIFDLAEGRIELTCLEKSRKRFQKMLHYFTQFDIQARALNKNALTFSEKGWDKILVDVPCSGEGIVTQLEEIRKKSGKEIQRLVHLQTLLLRKGFSLLRPGGTVVYSTCALNRYENEGVVEAFLEKHPGAKLEIPELPSLDLEVKQSEAGFRIMPGKTRGLFFTRIRKPL